jgi:tetratricopeptide (TPR) repeat protein
MPKISLRSTLPSKRISNRWLCQNRRKLKPLRTLTPAIERYHTLIGLQRYDDALVLFRDRLNWPTTYRLAAYGERVPWLERLFPDGVSGVPRLRRAGDIAWVLNALGTSYRISGQPNQAVPLLRKAIEIREQLYEEGNRQIVLVNLSDSLCAIGALFEAEHLLCRALALSRKVKTLFHEGVTLESVGRTFNLRGDLTLGQVTLRRGLNIFVKLTERQPEGVAAAELAECSIWRDEPVEAGDWAEWAWELAAVERAERDFIRAALLQGRIATGRDSFLRADERLHYALTRARGVNLIEFELPALIAIAELELARGRPADARARLDDVWEAAERGSHRLCQADAYNVLADTALAQGDKPAAIAAATKAYRAAWCDGPPYAYHWGLAKANAHLAALGAPEPEMPAFDESKFEPMPEVEINPKDEYWVDPDKLE